MTPRRRKRFLETLQATGNVTRACQAAAWSRNFAYERFHSDESFKEAWQGAMESFLDACEAEAYRRAVDGVDDPVIYQGQWQKDENGVPLTVKRYSDSILMFILKGRRREVYGDRSQTELTGPGGLPVLTEPKVHIYIPDNGRDRVPEDSGAAVQVYLPNNGRD